MPPALKRTVYTGTFISAPTPTTLDIREHLAVAVDENGIIVDKIPFLSESELGHVEEAYGDVVRWVERNGYEWVRVGEGRGGRWWFPGFVGE